MKKTVILIILAICASQAMQVSAQRSKRITNDDRDKWLIEMRNSKHEFLAKELELTRDQQNAFFSDYDKMEDELNKINTEVRDLEKKVIGDANATNTEIDSASRAIFEQKKKEGEIELSYYEKFKKTLKPKQLLRLKDAERKFTRKLVKQHGKIVNQ